MTTVPSFNHLAPRKVTSLVGSGDNVYVLCNDGTLWRLDYSHAIYDGRPWRQMDGPPPASEP